MKSQTSLSSTDSKIIAHTLSNIMFLRVCIVYSNTTLFFFPIKASAHSFKLFSSQILKLSFSLYASVTSEECHAWFHLNAASPAARNTKQVNMTKNLVHGRIQTTNTARPPDYKSTVITTRPQLAFVFWTHVVKVIVAHSSFLPGISASHDRSLEVHWYLRL